MEAKPAQQNIQDSFLNNARKERNNITIYLVSGVKLTGGSGRSTSTRWCSKPATRSSSFLSMRFDGGHHARWPYSRRARPVAAHAEAEIPNAASGTEDEVSWLAPR